MIIQADRIDNNKSDLFDALLHRKLLSLENKRVIEEVVYINEKASQTYAKRVCMKMISHVYKSLSQCLKKFLIVQKKV